MNLQELKEPLFYIDMSWTAPIPGLDISSLHDDGDSLPKNSARGEQVLNSVRRGFINSVPGLRELKIQYLGEAPVKGTKVNRPKVRFIGTRKQLELFWIEYWNLDYFRPVEGYDFENMIKKA